MQEKHTFRSSRAFDDSHCHNHAIFIFIVDLVLFCLLDLDGTRPRCHKTRHAHRFNPPLQALLLRSHPIQNLSAHLHDLSRSVAIHILPGESDPSGTIHPQKALPRAMFGHASPFASFFCETNPTYIRLSSGAQGGDDNCPRILGNYIEQPLNDNTFTFQRLPQRG